MVTGAIKNKVDKIWTDIWAGGITNPLTVIEQLTYLMFIRSLDEKELATEDFENMAGEKMEHIFGKLGAPRYGRYRCCHRHAGFPAFEPAFDLDRLCGLPSKGSGTPAHRGDLDTVGGRFMFIFRVQRRA